MELSEFITKTLIDISLGIKNANKIINDEYTDPASPKLNSFGLKKDSSSPIMFDVAIIAKDELSTEAKGKFGAGISVLSASLNGELKTASGSENSTRIRFNIDPQNFIH